MDERVTSGPVDLCLSAILTMPGHFETIRKTIRHLCAQTARDRMELVIVTTQENAALIDASDLDCLGAWQVVAIPQMRTGAIGWAAGIHHARSPVVVLCEDHSFPDPRWAEAFIDSHRQEYAAVSPVVHNANPRSLVSWANFLLCFGEWFSAGSSRLVSSGPGHNTSYKRDVLLDYAGLENWLESERILHFDLEAKGHRMLLDPRAATNHVNMSRPGSYLRHSFLGGRIFGAARAANWSRARACLQALAFPLVPAIRLWRLLQVLDRPAKRRESRFWPALPWIIAGFVMHGLGEGIGYISGVGGAVEKYTCFEMYRREHVTSADQAVLSV